MPTRAHTFRACCAAAILCFCVFTSAQRIDLTVTRSNLTVLLPPLPHVERFNVEWSSNLTTGFKAAPSNGVSGFSFTQALADPHRFYRLQISPVTSNDLLTSIVLNRLAYGPTPDELLRVKAMGPDAFIKEQLAPEKIIEDPSIEKFTQPREGWEYFEAVVQGNTPELWLGLDDGGVVYLDDIKLVKGRIAGLGTNLIRNGDFERPLGPEWQLGRDNYRSRIATNILHSGSGALLLQAEYQSQYAREFIIQRIEGIDPASVYTFSLWYYRRLNRPTFLLIGLLDQSLQPHLSLDVRTRLEYGLATPEDLRAHHLLRAIKARRQLLEILLQFVENHFVTAFSRTGNYFGHYAFFDGAFSITATGVNPHFKDLQRWRRALLSANCTFQDLLRIAAESVAMICYLDTYSNLGFPGALPNENFSRELLELFTFGVDNGYDQSDVTEMARVWTGWRVNLVDPANEYNPIAPKTTNAITEFSDPLPELLRHYYGVFTCGFDARFHDHGEKVLFANKVVPARFGAPYAGTPYELRMPARSGPSGALDGYDAIAHLANQPFTQEFICVKLCRLFVHDNFAIGYDFTSADLSPEGQLVRECMRAWENASPKGQIRPILEVIFSSDLFRSPSAASQKIKTPLEFVASAIRSLRTETASGEFTAGTDGYSLQGPLENMGRMILFDREHPDGFPETAQSMLGANVLVERMRFVQALLAPPSSRPIEAGKNVTDPVALLRKFMPAAALTDAGKVADWYLANLYPGTGKASMDLHRSLAMWFLNTSEDGQTPSPFAQLPVDSASYDLRVRGLAAMLLSLYNFNEQ